MWIEIKKDIFEDSDFKGLNFILQLLTWYPKESIPRYNIFINSEKINHLDNYKKLSGLDKEIIQKEFDDAINNGEKSKYIITNKNKKHNTLNIEEAIMFLNQPAYIIIENGLNDSYFLNAIFKHFDQKDDEGKRKLVEFVKNDWVRFVNAGGWTNIRNCVDGQLNVYNYLSEINSKEKFRYFRCFVMVDSDRQYPAQDIQDKDKLKEELETKGIKVHILKKRAMENYMPDDVIKTIATSKSALKETKSWVLVYEKLTSQQKDFLNYKDGFPKKKISETKEKTGSKGKKFLLKRITPTIQDRREMDRRIQALYSNLDDFDHTLLACGLHFPNFKNDFPVLFQDHHLVHKGSLLAREGGTERDNEFLEILDKIHDLL